MFFAPVQWPSVVAVGPITQRSKTERPRNDQTIDQTIDYQGGKDDAELCVHQRRVGADSSSVADRRYDRCILNGVCWLESEDGISHSFPRSF